MVADPHGLLFPATVSLPRSGCLEAIASLAYSPALRFRTAEETSMENRGSTFGGWNKEAKHTLLMLGVALGVPLGIIYGILTNQTGLGLMIGPGIGLGIGVVLSLMGKSDAA